MENPGGEETRGEVRSGDRRQACLSVADAGEPLCGSGESLCRSGGASVGVGEKPGSPETWISRNLDLQKPGSPETWISRNSVGVGEVKFRPRQEIRGNKAVVAGWLFITGTYSHL